MAVTDCEVVVVNEAVAAEVASRTPELSTVFNRVVKAWERRLDRMLESYAASQQEEAKLPTEAGAE